jgi:hypothetical protein
VVYVADPSYTDGLTLRTPGNGTERVNVSGGVNDGNSFAFVLRVNIHVRAQALVSRTMSATFPPEVEPIREETVNALPGTSPTLLPAITPQT